MIWVLGGFLLFVFLMLALDLGVFHRHAHVVTVREALGWSALWIALGVAFAAFVYVGYEHKWLGMGIEPDPVDGELNDGREAALKYITGYVVEKSLSIDNVFVISVIFSSFAVPAIYQHRVLFWGILGALAMRGVMIAAGAALIASFHWVLYLFGVLLILTALKMLTIKGGHVDPNRNIVVRLTRRLLPVTRRLHGEHFFVRAGDAASHEAEVPGAAILPDEAVAQAAPRTLMLTPLALALVMVEVTDLIFAVDSIPAIFAITADWFLVFTSNVFAILGLRSLYFALAGMIDKFRYLKMSLALVLLLVGVKMLAASWFKEVLGKNFNLYLLAAVLFILLGGVLASWMTDRKRENELEAE